ncbi:MAG: ABC transporter permease [Deltaproteobacteria bacterium]|nr:ABC transporter permease [Deltaproteobacteria bacterium]
MSGGISQARLLPLRLLGLLGETMRAMIKRPPSLARLLDQMHNIGNRSLVFISVTLGFLGLISVYQGSIQAQKVLPDLSMVGATFINVMISEFGPTITALMIATRVGSGIAAELGAMVVTEQVEALKMTNTDPIEFVVVPRFIATVIMMFVMTVYGVLVAVLAGMVIADLRFQVNPSTFLSLGMTGWSDLCVGLIKCFAYGVAIPIIAADAGFHASGGSEGVGQATTRAVVNTLFAVIILDFIIAGGWYLL